MRLFAHHVSSWGRSPLLQVMRWLLLIEAVLLALVVGGTSLVMVASFIDGIQPKLPDAQLPNIQPADVGVTRPVDQPTSKPTPCVLASPETTPINSVTCLSAD